MKSLENNDPVLDGDYSTRENRVLKCLNAARRKGNRMFALKNGGECLSSAGGHLDVKAAYEVSVECVNENGGVNAMNVYIIKGKLQFQQLQRERLALKLHTIIRKFVKVCPLDQGWRTYKTTLGTGYSLIRFLDGNRPFARSGHMVQNHTCW